MKEDYTLKKLFDWLAQHNQVMEDASKYCGCTREELEETLDSSKTLQVLATTNSISEVQFQEYLLNHYKEDAIQQAKDRGIELNKEEASLLAKQFNNQKDCNVPDNDTWDVIITNYIRC